MSSTVIWNTKGIRPVLMCFACEAEAHELCDGKHERRHWFKRLPCDCAPDHDWSSP